MGKGANTNTNTNMMNTASTQPMPSGGKGGGKGGGMPTGTSGMPTGTRYDRSKSFSENLDAGVNFPGMAPDGSFNPPTSYGSAPSSLGQVFGGGNAGGPEGPPPSSNMSRIADAALGLRMNFGGPYGSSPAPAGGGAAPAPAGGGKGGGIGEMSDYMKEAAGRIGQPRTPPAGGGLFGGLANAANLVNQQRRRNEFINSDNQLNTIRAEQMELERKARQEALNRSYYDQPEEPTVAQQPANIAEPAQPPLQFGDPGYMPTYNPSIPASRNPYDRSRMGQMERLNAAYRNRLERFNNPMQNIPEALRKYNDMLRLRGDPEPRMETEEQRTKRLFSYIGEPADRFGPVDPKLDAEYDNFLRTRMNPNQVMNRFTGVRRAAFGEPLQISSAFGGPSGGLRPTGREILNSALLNAPVGDGPRVNSGRGGKGDFGAYAPYVNI